MTPESLVAELCERGVAIESAGGELRLDAPAGAMTPDLLAAVKSCKAELLKILQSRADVEWDRFLGVCVPMAGGGWRDPSEPVLQRGIPGERWDAFVRDCGRWGKGKSVSNSRNPEQLEGQQCLI